MYTTLIHSKNEDSNLKCSRYTIMTGTGYWEFYIADADAEADNELDADATDYADEASK